VDSILDGVNHLRDAVAERFESLGAIIDAVMQGQFAVAGEIAWESIKLSFAEGIAWVTDAWTEFTTGLATVFDGLVTTIRQAWNNVSTFIGQVLMLQVARVQQLLDKLAEFDPTGMAAKLRASLDIDVGATILAMDEDRQRFNRGLDRERSERDDQRARAMQDRLTASEERVANLQRARDQALARARQALAENSDRESPLARAVEDLELAIAEAAKAPKLFDDKAATTAVEQAGMDALPAVEAATGITGTFSAAAAVASLGFRQSSAEEETADNTRVMRRRLEIIAREQRLRDAPVFS
jgi:hypothetical protein